MRDLSPRSSRSVIDVNKTALMRKAVSSINGQFQGKKKMSDNDEVSSYDNCNDELLPNMRRHIL